MQYEKSFKKCRENIRLAVVGEVSQFYGLL